MIERKAILIPIDIHGVDRPSLETLVGIARELDRGLLALVLENPDLRRVAELPFTTEIVLTGGERDLRPADVGRLGRSTRFSQRTLSELARASRVSVSFEDAAGDPLESALLHQDAPDLFLPVRRHWQASGSNFASGRMIQPSLGLVLTGGEEDSAVISGALALQALGHGQDIYLFTANPPDLEQLQLLSKAGARVRLQNTLTPTPQNLCDIIRKSRYSILVLPKSAVTCIPPALRKEALDSAKSQVFMVA